VPLFRNRYRVESTRLRGWDYSAPAWYFVTICTKGHACCLGRISQGQMVLSEMGAIVAEEWQRTAVIRPDIRLDAWVVMPNHLHGIVIIDSGGTEAQSVGFERARPDRAHSAAKPGQLRPGSLGAIVGQVKSACTKRIRGLGHINFDWQPRFHDHIIRDEAELARIREYVLNNPAKWELDRYYSAHVS
jgi:REP element-mobilizing transposase RayT